MHVQPSTYSTLTQDSSAAMQGPEQKEAGGLFHRSRINAKPHHWLHCSLTHTHPCREKKEGILTGPAWLGTQFQNLGKKQRKKKKEKNVKLRETWKYILSKQYKNRGGGKKRNREREREKGGGRLLVGGSDFKPGYSSD